MSDLTESIHEQFQTKQLDSRLAWQSPPSNWDIDTDAACLRLTPDSPTDFWQRTHYGFRSDNGHLLYASIPGCASLETKLRMFPRHQYDQAGLMIWVSPSCWVKTSVEYEPDGDNQLGAVVTNSGYSDWSTQPVHKNLSELWFRMLLQKREVIIQTSLDGLNWQQLRVAPLLERLDGEPVRCGLYACSPKSAGFCVEYEYLKIEF